MALHCSEVPLLAGIVIERLDAQIGVWQYSLDDGANWQVVRTDLLHREGPMGLVLALGARLRVLPFAASGAVFACGQRRQEGGNGGMYCPYPGNLQRPEAPPSR